MPELHYLESLDSTRVTPTELGGDAGQGESLQVFLDVMVAMLLGRDIVVPQAYALDSTSFMRVASTLALAHEFRLKNNRPSTLPITLHLYNQASYPAAVAAMLERMDELGEKTFHSSFLHYQGMVGSGHVNRGRRAGEARGDPRTAVPTGST